MLLLKKQVYSEIAYEISTDKNSLRPPKFRLMTRSQRQLIADMAFSRNDPSTTIVTEDRIINVETRTVKRKTYDWLGQIQLVEDVVVDKETVDSYLKKAYNVIW